MSSWRHATQYNRLLLWNNCLWLCTETKKLSNYPNIQTRVKRVEHIPHLIRLQCICRLISNVTVSVTTTTLYIVKSSVSYWISFSVIYKYIFSYLHLIRQYVFFLYNKQVQWTERHCHLSVNLFTCQLMLMLINKCLSIAWLSNTERI